MAAITHLLSHASRGNHGGHQIDEVRRLARDVLIGAAYQKAKHRGARFLLTTAK